MLGEPNDLEKFVEEVLRKLLAKRPVTEGNQVLSTRGLQASPSTRRRSTWINPINEQRSKHRSDLANVKQILSIMPKYILPLASFFNHDSIPNDFKYCVFTVYIPKGIRIVGSQLEKISLLKHSDFNLGDQKNYTMLAPHRYLTKTTGKKPHLVP